ASVVAVPTTAGSGSEATRFAALYVDGIKHSLDHAHLRPAVALVDANLVLSSPPLLLASTGLDALCQSIESYWAVRATPASRALARQGIEAVWTHLTHAVRTGDSAAIAALSRGAWCAGRAIDQTRTTAAHALSYPLTMHLGIPHGHAVALTLPFFFRINGAPGDRALQSGVQASELVATMRALCDLLGGGSIEACAQRLEALPPALGLTHRLGDAADAELSAMAREINLARLANNPVAIGEEDVLEAWQRLR
ncbi:MAG: iron-containing alcohol dehydrogenase, partial [Pseudomonadota bacterium]